MIVIGFSTIIDFVAELKAERDNIADKIVRWQWVRTPEQPEQISFQVNVWATAIKRGGDIECLLEFGLATGRDRVQKNGTEGDGSRAAEQLLNALEDACESLGLEIRPGKIEVY